MACILLWDLEIFLRLGIDGEMIALVHGELGRSCTCMCQYMDAILARARARWAPGMGALGKGSAGML